MQKHSEVQMAITKKYVMTAGAFSWNVSLADYKREQQFQIRIDASCFETTGHILHILNEQMWKSRKKLPLHASSGNDF